MVAGEPGFFYPPPGEAVPGKPGGQRREIGINELYATLIAANHGKTPVEIGGRHTWRQMQAFLAEAHRVERRRRRERIDDVNAAFAGGPPAEKLKHDLED